jgi:hypothetical protein
VGSEAFGGATLRRIERLTLALGAAGSVAAGWRWGWRGAVGLAIGAILSWINFRWLKGSVLAFGRAATATAPAATASESVQAARVPTSAYAKFFGRFALLLVAVYVILTHSALPAISVLAGLFASAAAVVLGLMWELTLGGIKAN